MQAGLLAAAVLIAFTALVVLGLWKGVLSEWVRRWPAVAGVAVGLAWWLWLWPSILGLGLVLVSLAVSLWSGRKHVAPPPGSSVISLRSVQG